MTKHSRSKRESLTAFTERLCDEATREAISQGGYVEAGLAAALSAALQRPDLKRRWKQASQQEQARCRAMVDGWAKELTAQGVPPRQRRWVRNPAGDTADLRQGTMEQVVRDNLHDNTQGLSDDAGPALRAAAGKGGEAPTPQELATWIGGGGCPAEALDEAAARLAALWGLAPGAVRVTGWGFGGLVGWADGTREFHAPAADLLSLVQQERERTGKYPLAPLVRAWQRRPRLVRPRAASKAAVMPASLAMVNEGNRRDRLFSLAAHVGADGQSALPGFERPHGNTPALPLALYELGGGEADTRGKGAPLALRLFVVGLLAFSLEDRGGVVAIEITLRDLLDKLYPGPGRPPKPTEYLPRLRAAIDAVNTFRLPWRDPTTGKGGLWSAVLVRNLPAGLDDLLRVEVDLPPGSEIGPQVPASLGAWGTQSAAAYRGLLNLSYQWHDPGRTVIPLGSGRRRHWQRVYDPERYEPLTDADLVDVFLPTTAIGRHDHRVEKAKEIMYRLEEAGDLQIVRLNAHERRILPALPPGRTEAPEG